MGVPPGNAAIAQPPPWIQGRSGCASAYARDRGEVVVAGGQLRQVAADPLQPALHGVHVSVDEAGRHQAARQVDLGDAGAAGQRVVGRHGDDPVGLDHDAVAGPVPLPVEGVAVAEDQGHQRPSSSGPAGSWSMPTLRAASPESASRQTRLARYAVISAWS